MPLEAILMGKPVLLPGESRLLPGLTAVQVATVHDWLCESAQSHHDAADGALHAYLTTGEAQFGALHRYHAAAASAVLDQASRIDVAVHAKRQAGKEAARAARIDATGRV